MPVASSERVLDRHVVEVAVPALAGLVDELAGEEVAIARVALDVPGDVVGGEDVRLGPDVAGGRGGPRPQDGTTLVVDRVAIRGSPEEVLLQRQRETVHRAEADARAGADDVLPADVVDVPQVRVGIR